MGRVVREGLVLNYVRSEWAVLQTIDIDFETEHNWDS